jgi:cation diffusion facilitator CzcD-associated flavoprotein CzcO
MAGDHFDVAIIGAGLSGVGAACRLQKACPSKTYAILEGREDLGGTWDLFRYPGVRSDSDMFTLSYPFRPWTHAKAIARGRSILTYIRDTAREYGVDQKIRFGHRLRAASWSSAEARWTLEVERGPEREVVRLSCGFLIMCAGYYAYEDGYSPTFPGVARFRGRIVHPQHWSPDVDYVGKRVVVIGSGATAITLAPELAKRAAHVVMVQRSPSYVIERPSSDGFADALRAALPERLAYRLARWKNILIGAYFYRFCRRNPQSAKWLLLSRVRDALDPNYDVATHFTPPYDPWEKRLCVVPDGDLFRAIRNRRASVVTGRIETFTESGVALSDGQEIEADLVVTATGLVLQPLGGVRLSVDGAAVDLGKTLTYKGAMLSGVPNLASVFGYANASWTLKADLICQYVCRLLNHMEARGYRQCAPRADDAPASSAPLIDLEAGHFQRAPGQLPRQGLKWPWRWRQDYARDVLALKFGRIADDALRFSPPRASRRNGRVGQGAEPPSRDRNGAERDAAAG